jgi:hypothetical protein
MILKEYFTRIYIEAPCLEETMSSTPATFTVFDGEHRVAEGSAATAMGGLRRRLATVAAPQILIFADATGALVELQHLEWLAREEESAPSSPADEPARRPGRPRLGVVAREVTLLPRHWEWLNDQPGGASVALRKLVDQARHDALDTDRVRRARDAAYRVMSSLAGDRPHYEEALRALYAGDSDRFATLIAEWPKDIRHYVGTCAAPAFHAEATAAGQA